MLVLEFGQVVDITVDGDVQAVRLVVGRHIGGREGFGHGDDDDDLSVLFVCDGEI